jgi:hypothetical protein
MKELAGYAAGEGVIAHHRRGNLTGFINWCLEIGEDVLRKHHLKNKGF